MPPACNPGKLLEFVDQKRGCCQQIGPLIYGKVILPDFRVLPGVQNLFNN